MFCRICVSIMVNKRCSRVVLLYYSELSRLQSLNRQTGHCAVTHTQTQNTAMIPQHSQKWERSVSRRMREAIMLWRSSMVGNSVHQWQSAQPQQHRRHSNRSLIGPHFNGSVKCCELIPGVDLVAALQRQCLSGVCKSSRRHVKVVYLSDCSGFEHDKSVNLVLW